MSDRINFLESYDHDDVETAAEVLAHEMWTMGHLNPAPHDCPYTGDHDRDSDYANECGTCRKFLEAIAETVVESDWFQEHLESAAEGGE